MNRFGLFILILFFFTSCKKNSTDTQQVFVPTSFEHTIRFIEMLDNKVILGGGIRNSTGFIGAYDYPTDKITIIQDSFPEPIYSAAEYNGRSIFGMESGKLLYTFNNKFFFEHVLNEKDFYPTLHQRPVRDIQVSKDNRKVFTATGAEYYYGLMQTSSDTFNTLQPQTYRNELRCIAFTKDGRAFAGGFGILLYSEDDGSTWKRLEFDPVFITSIRFSTDAIGTMATFDGNFYFTDNGGSQWRKSRVAGRAGGIQQIIFTDNDVALAVGENGTFCLSEDGGRNWNCEKSFDGTDLNAIFKISPGTVLLGGEKGKLWRVLY